MKCANLLRQRTCVHIHVPALPLPSHTIRPDPARGRTGFHPHGATEGSPPARQIRRTGAWRRLLSRVTGFIHARFHIEPNTLAVKAPNGLL